MYTTGPLTFNILIDGRGASPPDPPKKTVTYAEKICPKNWKFGRADPKKREKKSVTYAQKSVLT